MTAEVVAAVTAAGETIQNVLTAVINAKAEIRIGAVILVARMT